jgi:hypothetical protein
MPHRASRIARRQRSGAAAHHQAQAGGDPALRLRTGCQHALEAAFRCSLVAQLEQQDVKFGAMLIYRRPQQIGFSVQRNEHLAQDAWSNQR